MINFSLDTSLRLGRFVFELSFWLRDWGLEKNQLLGGSIHTLHVGPFFFAFTDLKRIKQFHEVIE